MRAAAVIALVGCSFQPAPVVGGGAAAPDAPPDVTAASLVIEAEAFSALTMPGPRAWTAQTDKPGFSGAAFMQCGPGTGAYCPNDAALDTCAATLVYQLSIDTAATYWVHVRGFAVDASDDTMWYGLDGTPAPDALGIIHDSQWHWSTGATSYVLSSGAHTLTIWQRECGARADVVAVTPSQTPPP